MPIERFKYRQTIDFFFVTFCQSILLPFGALISYTIDAIIIDSRELQSEKRHLKQNKNEYLLLFLTIR